MQSQELLDVLADSSPLFIAYVDNEQRYRFANRTYSRRLNRPLEQIIGKHVQEVLGPRAYSGIRQHIETALSGRAVSHETCVPLADLGDRWLSVLVAPHVVEGGRVAGLVVFADDVTERRRAEEAAHNHHQLLSCVFDGTSDAVFVKDLEGRYLMMNAAARRVTRRSDADIIGRTDHELYPPHLADQFRADDQRVLAGQEQEFVEQLMPLTGSFRTFLTKKVAFRDASGHIAGILGVARDITERRGAEQALRESEARVRAQLAELEHVYGTSPVGLCLQDRDLRIIRINERLAAIDGMSVADHIGHTLAELLPDVGRIVEPIMRQVVQSGHPALDVEVKVPNPADPQSELVGLVSCHPLKAADGRVEGMTTAVQDITERKRLEEALRANQERLGNILESAMDAIVTIDRHGVVLLFNSAAEKMFNCTADSAMGRSFDRFASAGFGPFVRGWIDGHESGGASAQYGWAPLGLKLIRASGQEFPVEATISRAAAADQSLYTIIVRDVDERQRAQDELRRLQAENINLREEVGVELESIQIVGRSPAIQRLLSDIEQVAATDSTVLITGETGTGKELVAKAIHERSRRCGAPLVKVNCAALPGGLIESELFGHEKGAFTGALARKLGRFELADTGTIFLDEIGDLPLDLQAKLLRVLQDGEFERVGASQTLRTDARVIAATNRNLGESVAEQSFRADLYYRLNVFPVHIPPLRERRDDIPLLIRHAVLRYAHKLGKRITAISEDAIDALTAYDWPGNVRELQNAIERGVILSAGPSLERGNWVPRTAAGSAPSPATTLAEVERRHVLSVLDSTGWRVSGEQGAARVLGLKPTTLEARMKKLGIVRPVH